MTLCVLCYDFFFFKQKTAYEMRISDWSSDVCSSDLLVRQSIRRRLEDRLEPLREVGRQAHYGTPGGSGHWTSSPSVGTVTRQPGLCRRAAAGACDAWTSPWTTRVRAGGLAKAAVQSSSRSEEHTSELQSLMRIAYAV